MPIHVASQTFPLGRKAEHSLVPTFLRIHILLGRKADYSLVPMFLRIHTPSAVRPTLGLLVRLVFVKNPPRPQGRLFLDS